MRKIIVTAALAVAALAVTAGDRLGCFVSPGLTLSAGVNFDYGLSQSGGWYMTGRVDGYNGQLLSAAQIRKDFAGYQIWAWVGVDDSGTTSHGYVTSVDGHQADAILGLEAQGGNVIAYVLPFSRGFSF